MLFRDHTGNLVELRKHDFTTDAAYYKTVLTLKQKLVTKHETLNMYNTQGVGLVSNMDATVPKAPVNRSGRDS